MSGAELVSTDWLAARIGGDTLRIVDASWYLAAEKRDPASEYRERHIPGAVWFALDAASDQASPLPHMLPSAEVFASLMGELGIGDGDQVVVYDGAGLFSAARLWWMLRAFGHDKVAVVDGGLPKWLAEGRPVATGAPEITRRDFRARLRPELVRAFDDVHANLSSHREQVLDARSPGRFKGLEPEPRPGVRPGHIPGSLNLHYASLLDPEDHTLLANAELASLFDGAGVDRAKPVICSCGSGITAAILAFALGRLGAREVSVYDGSWSEWGARADAPIET
ncbi:MAG: 3-mercaptopyruvate sulfurtransferase [Alphaproteobacteria bacterium]